MKVLTVRNVHEALPKALQLLYAEGIERPSRNGPVLQMPCPVTTVYTNPLERVLFWPQRDANPFFHLYESLWMLAGRNDIKPLLRYAKQMKEYSDDGLTLHGAYGYRWRKWLSDWSKPNNLITGEFERLDQLELIAIQLKENPNDRRCVLQMWDGQYDLGSNQKDVPCNDTATFQIDAEGKLNLVVFCRSNDVIWGCYGANAVHFSFLLEYMAHWIGCPVGTYSQVSVNWHGYLSTLPTKDSFLLVEIIPNPYVSLHHSPLFHGTHEALDEAIATLLMHEETRFHLPHYPTDEPFFDTVYLMLRAHLAFRENEAPVKFTEARKILALGDQKNDWIVAGTEWMLRREANWHGNQNKS